jgi:hypothetical protein
MSSRDEKIVSALFSPFMAPGGAWRSFELSCTAEPPTWPESVAGSERDS